MKKIIILSLTIFITLSSFCGIGCGKNDENKKTSIVCTIFPEYDWVMQILGKDCNRFDVTYLTHNGVDLHSYRPSVKDIATIASCKLFIYVGGESDAWVKDALNATENNDRICINLMDVLSEKLKDEHSDNGVIGGDVDKNHEEEDEKDEHVWLSLKNAMIVCDEIYSAIARLDEKNVDAYYENLQEYKIKLNELDNEFVEKTASLSYDTLVFGDRFPFRYFVDDYGLNYYAVFSGCSENAEASFETVVFLVKKVDELRLPAVCILEGGNSKLAHTIKESTKTKNQKIVTFDSMQSTTMKDYLNGSTYLSIMQYNLRALLNALSD